MSAGPRVGVVVITHQRRPEVLHTLRRLRDLPERPPVVVVDNASTDGTADAVAAQHPEAALVRSPVNLGAVARNVGVEALDTPYVAFCDDDTWWATVYTRNYYLRGGTTVAKHCAAGTPEYETAVPGYTYGALFITFNAGGDPGRAEAYFKTIDGEIIDRFSIVKGDHPAPR